MDDKLIDDALAGVASMYDGNLAAHGVSAKSVGWRDAETQDLRFAKLCEVIAGAAPFTVNDFGCGYGAMFTYLANTFGSRLSAYRGFDISNEMLRAARERLADDRVELVPGATISQAADYTFVSGTYNVRLQASDEEWRAHIERSLDDVAAHSTRGFAFNLLSTYVDWKQDGLFYADPLYFFDLCKRKYSRFVSLLHDYPLYEWTILVRT